MLWSQAFVVKLSLIGRNNIIVIYFWLFGFYIQTAFFSVIVDFNNKLSFFTLVLI